jgi:hypothetical protein
VPSLVVLGLPPPNENVEDVHEAAGRLQLIVATCSACLDVDCTVFMILKIPIVYTFLGQTSRSFFIYHHFFLE